MIAPAELLQPIREAPDTTTEDMQIWFLDHAPRYPQAFKLLPVPSNKPTDPGTWCMYPFDDGLSMWVNVAHPEGMTFLQQYKMMIKEEKMSKELTVQEKQNVMGLLKGNIQAIRSVVPKHLTPERLTRLIYQAIVKMPKLAQCSQLSLINAAIGASQLGLEVGGPLGQCQIIPFKEEAVLIVEYKGKIALAFNSGQVRSFAAHPVYENDLWEYEYGLHPLLKHRPCDNGDRGNLVAAYACVEFVNGGVDFEVCNPDAAKRAFDASQAKNKPDSPWNQPADVWTMWVKTAVHQLSKRIPQSPELQRANDLEEQAEKRGKQDLDYVIDVDLVPMPPQIGADADPKGAAQQPPEGEQKKQGDNGNGGSDPEKDLKNLEVLKKQFPIEYGKACVALTLNPNNPVPPDLVSTLAAKIGEIANAQNGGNEQ